MSVVQLIHITHHKVDSLLRNITDSLQTHEASCMTCRHRHTFTSLLLAPSQRSSQWPITARLLRVTPTAPSHHHPSLCPVPHPNAEASLLLSTQSCSTPWPCAVPHYTAVRKLLGAPVTLKDWWRKMGRRRGEEQVVKKRMSCLMGCQECNSIIMKSDSGELAGWMDGSTAAEEVGGCPVLRTCLSILSLLVQLNQVNRTHLVRPG